MKAEPLAACPPPLQALCRANFRRPPEATYRHASGALLPPLDEQRRGKHHSSTLIANSYLKIIVPIFREFAFCNLTQSFKGLSACALSVGQIVSIVVGDRVTVIDKVEEKARHS